MRRELAITIGLSIISSPLLAQVSRGNTYTDLSKAMASFLNGYHQARAQRDSGLIVVAPQLLDLAFEPDTLRSRALRRLLPVHLQVLLDASRHIRARFTLRPDQTSALLTLEGEIARLLNP